MDHTHPPTDSFHSAQRVRSNFGSAALATAFLIYFGFFRLLEPSTDELFGKASWVFYHTLRIGGIAMALVAGASLTGHRLALAADGAVSLVIGVLLVLTGVGMVLGGGGMMQLLINIVCGGMFIGAGRANLQGFIVRQAGSSRAEPVVFQREAESSYVPGYAGDELADQDDQGLPMPQRFAELDSLEPEKSSQGATLPTIEDVSTVEGGSAERMDHPPSVDGNAGTTGGFLASFGQDEPPSNT